MGKKKGKKNQGYDQDKLNEIADSLEKYSSEFDLFIIKDGMCKEEYKKAMKTIKKTIKKLRNGDGDAVFDKDRFNEIMEQESGDNY